MAMTGVSGTAAALSMGCRTTLVRTAIRGIRSGVKVFARDVSAPLRFALSSNLSIVLSFAGSALTLSFALSFALSFIFLFKSPTTSATFELTSAPNNSSPLGARAFSFL
jgi:hypothetical protein